MTIPVVNIKEACVLNQHIFLSKQNRRRINTDALILYPLEYTVTNLKLVHLKSKSFSNRFIATIKSILNIKYLNVKSLFPIPMSIKFQHKDIPL